jgi:hypothetical protein
MSGSFPDSTNFKNIKISDAKKRLETIDTSNKLYEKFLKQRWGLELSSIPLTRSQFQSIFSFLTQQKAQTETFTIIPPQISNPQGTAAGGPMAVLQNYAIGIGTIKANGATGTLKRGDFIKFSNHSKIYQIISDVDMDASSEDTINFYPNLLSAITTSTTIQFSSIPFTVSLITDANDYDLDREGYYRYNLNLIEEY